MLFDDINLVFILTLDVLLNGDVGRIDIIGPFDSIGHTWVLIGPDLKQKLLKLGCKSPYKHDKYTGLVVYGNNR